jgi:hypothetical protein
MSGRSISLPTILGAVLIGVILFAVLLAILWGLQPAEALLPSTSAVVTVIPAPSKTLAAVTPTSQAPPTITPAPPPSQGNISVGSLVQVAGTGGDGLRLRVEPSLDAEVRFLGLEAEVFDVEGGPVEADGFTWFLLVTPRDETRRGWAVSSYLVTVQNP